MKNVTSGQKTSLPDIPDAHFREALTLQAMVFVFQSGRETKLFAIQVDWIEEVLT